jgi:hypothetical protein
MGNWLGTYFGREPDPIDREFLTDYAARVRKGDGAIQAVRLVRFDTATTLQLRNANELEGELEPFEAMYEFPDGSMRPLWIVKRCQSLFLVFLAEIQGTICFIASFTFQSFSHNKSFWPYVGITFPEWERAIYFSIASLFTLLVSFIVFSYILYRRTQVNAFFVGADHLLHPNYLVVITLLVVLVLKLTDSFFMKHTYSLFLLLERGWAGDGI